MSLINQMLQDLDARRAVDAKAALPSHVCVLPREKPSVIPKIALGGIVLSALCAGIFWTLQPLSGTLKSNHSESNGLPSGTVTSPQSAITDASKVLRPASSDLPTLSSSDLNKSDVSQPSSSKPVAETSVALPEREAERPAPARLAPANAGKVQTVPPSNVATLVVQKPVPREPASEHAPARTRVAASPPTAAATPPSAGASWSNAGQMVLEKRLRLATASDRAENEYSKAVGVLNQGRVNDAISSLYAALREDPAHSAARQDLVAILIEQKRLDEARIVLQKGLALNAAQPAIAMKLARIDVERNDLNSARQTLERSGASATGNADYRAFYAGVLQRLNEHGAAINEYQAALRLAPEASTWWMGLGLSLEAEGRAAEARDAFQRARAGNNLSTDLDHFVEQRLRQLQ